MATRSHKLIEVSNVVPIANGDDAGGAATSDLLEKTGYRIVIFGSSNASVAVSLPGNSGVLLDMRMPGANGLEVLRALLGQGHIEAAVRAAKPGAADLLEKPGASEPPKAIGDAPDTPAERKAVAVDPDAAARIASLSERQRQVLQGIIEGKLNKIIAHELGIGVRTVESYRALLLIKLKARGTAEAVRLALAAGMLG
jgi:two-component system response regulator FixJ